MPRPVMEIELNPDYLAEAKWRFGDVDQAIKQAIPWVLVRVVPARNYDQLCDDLDELPTGVNVLRAVVAGELLAHANARPDVRRWLCEYLDHAGLTEGARYQLAGTYSRLGVESRRSNRLPEAVDFAKRGLETVADLPARAVTANLYYNLAVALEGIEELDSAIQAFEDAAEIDEQIGRADEAANARECVSLLRRRG